MKLKAQTRDIIGLFDKNGTQVVAYIYDSWGKIISTTGTLASTVGVLLGHNVFAYCESNPIIKIDIYGNIWNYIIGIGLGAVIGGAIFAVTDLASQASKGGKINYKNTNLSVYERPVQVDLTVKTSIYNTASSTFQGSGSNELYSGDNELWVGGYDNVDFGLV